MKSIKIARIISILAVCMVIIICVFTVLNHARTDIGKQSECSIRDSVIRSAIQCYSIEGVYPESLEYLETKYGLVINHNRYIVTYDAYSSNMLPDVSVLVRGEN